MNDFHAPAGVSVDAWLNDLVLPSFYPVVLLNHYAPLGAFFYRLLPMPAAR